jgi:hypothetical protein
MSDEFASVTIAEIAAAAGIVVSLTSHPNDLSPEVRKVLDAACEYLLKCFAPKA